MCAAIRISGRNTPYEARIVGNKTHRCACRDSRLGPRGGLYIECSPNLGTGFDLRDASCSRYQNAVGKTYRCACRNGRTQGVYTSNVHPNSGWNTLYEAQAWWALHSFPIGLLYGSPRWYQTVVIFCRGRDPFGAPSTMRDAHLGGLIFACALGIQIQRA